MPNYKGIEVSAVLLTEADVIAHNMGLTGLVEIAAGPGASAEVPETPVEVEEVPVEEVETPEELVVPASDDLEPDVVPDASEPVVPASEESEPDGGSKRRRRGHK